MPQTKLPLGTPDETEAAFYDALLNGDIDQLMSCWSDEDEIVCVLPGTQRLIGYAVVRTAFETLMMNGGVRVHVERLHKVDAPSTRVHNALIRVEVGNHDQSGEAFWVQVTSVYSKTARGWRMVAHHASPGVFEDPNHSWTGSDSTLH